MTSGDKPALAGELAKSINLTMQRKLSLLYEIYRLTAQEYSYVCAENVELFGNIVAGKQELMDDIDGLDRVFLDEYAALKEALGLPAAAGGAAAAEALASAAAVAEAGPSAGVAAGAGGVAGIPELRLNTAEILAILAKIEELDAKISQRVAKLRDSLAADLARLRMQKHANSVYSNERPAKNGGAAPVAQAPYRAMFDKRK
ncbi:MAG: hypothetical protein LBJ10_06050 [Clostridiales bacterium]|jgi:hypothetical protein|nr:hypothetical protein [Clostridiales bacterium]